MGATGRDVHFDALLSQMAINYRPAGFVADLVFPTVTVGKQSDHYAVWDQGDLFRVEDTKRSPGQEANIVVPSVSSGTYYAENYAQKTFITLEDLENADPGMWGSDRQMAAQFVVDKLKLDWENRVASTACSTTTVGSWTTTASEWGYNEADPVADIFTAIDNVRGSTGYQPNRILLAPTAWSLFKRSKKVRDVLFPHGGGIPTAQQAATIFGVDQVLVANAYKNTANEGQSQSLSTIWPEASCLVYYAPTAPTRSAPSYGYSFRWQKGKLPSMQVEVHPFDSKTKREEIEAGYYQDEKLTAAALGFIITDVNTST